MKERIPEGVRDLIPARFVEQHRIVPLALTGRVLAVAHPESVDPAILREISILLNIQVQGVVKDARALEELIRANYGVGAQEIENLVRSEDETGKAEGNGRTKGAVLDRTDLSQDAAIVAFVNNLLKQAIEDGATDVHIEPFENRLRVRFRIDGVLHEIPVPGEVFRFHTAVVSRVKVMANLDIAEHRLPQDGKFRSRMNGREVDFRVSILPTPHGETVTVRILVNAAILMGLESLGLESSDLAIIHEMLEKPHGVVLVTGPTGSGKTTTLYSFLSILNQAERKILTIEDPIEYDLQGVTQIQVRPKVGLDFAHGLRSMLRHDPDVMMVGEIRDEETAETVIRVALTGHLVFSTVHTNDAASTPIRLLDMGVEPYLVASSVECIIAQRLVRIVCQECQVREARGLSADALGIEEEVLEHIVEGKRGGFRTGRGCAHCRFTGYRGRTAIFEILPVSRTLRELILKREPAEKLAVAARRQGFWPLRWKGLALAARGVTTVEEILRVSAAQERDAGIA
jgi:type II secretory ATPase GspE/PulE/Tfp pilus assembly ATPase PilB-like protein